MNQETIEIDRLSKNTEEGESRKTWGGKEVMV